MQTRDRVNWNTLGKGWGVAYLPNSTAEVGACLPAKSVAHVPLHAAHAVELLRRDIHAAPLENAGTALLAIKHSLRPRGSMTNPPVNLDGYRPPQPFFFSIFNISTRLLNWTVDDGT